MDASELSLPKGEEVGVSRGDGELAGKMDAVLAMQKQLAKGQDDLSVQLRQMASVLKASASMLGALLQDEYNCPRWLVLVPKPPAEGALTRTVEWLKPKNWINQTVVLHFVCPVTRSAVGAGFELQLPRDWVTKYGPAIRVR